MTDSPAPTAAPPAVPASPTRASKVPIILILGGIVVFLAVVLWLVRDNQSADDLAVGTCFDVPSTTEGISTVTKHPCTEAHDAEVFHVAEYPDGSTYPISLGIDRFIEDECVPAFATYVGTAYADSAELGIGYFYPDRDAWGSGDRTFTCYVVNADESKLTESLKGSAGS